MDFTFFHSAPTVLLQLKYMLHVLSCCSCSVWDIIVNLNNTVTTPNKVIFKDFFEGHIRKSVQDHWLTKNDLVCPQVMALVHCIVGNVGMF